MEQRHLGRGGPAVSAMGLGCMGMSPVYGPADDDTSIAVLNRAIELGMTFWDTADAYGAGHNEKLLARVLSSRRDEVFLCTKFANRRRSDGTPGLFVDSSPSYVPVACEASLQRLGVDTIDLYYMHRRNPHIPIEETVGAMASLVAAGKIRYIGLSEVKPETLRAAYAVHPIAAVQMEYSLFTREIEGEMLATCRELGVAVVAYSPVGRGILTGTVTERSGLDSGDFRLMNPRFADANIDANLKLVEAVRAVAAEIGCTPAQAALAWVLAQGDDIIPIPGTKRLAYLEENAAAVSLTLSAEQLDALSAAVPVGAVAGDRYPEVSMRYVNG